MIWQNVKRLALNQATLTQVLSEAELRRMGTGAIAEQASPMVLIAGGGRTSKGSESIVTNMLSGSTKLVFVDINVDKHPSVMADLMHSWPFKDATFDLVVSTWVCEHLTDPVKFFSEAQRVLSANEGKLICLVPFIYRKHGSPFDFWRFTDAALLRLCNLCGFAKVEVHQIGGTPFLACLTLLWPLLRIPFIGLLLLALARLLDLLLRVVSKVTKRGGELVNSYPISYIVYTSK